jgi:Acetyltransferase (GNAT) domain
MAPDPDTSFAVQTPTGIVRIACRREVEELAAHGGALAHSRKDIRYYAIVEDTLEGFEQRWFVLEDHAGLVRGIQPFFLVDQDLLAGYGPRIARAVALVRRVLPRFLRARTLMVGCAAGEGQLGFVAPGDAEWVARTLHDALFSHAKIAGARLVMLKEFPTEYRRLLSCFSENGYTRIPSFPMTRANIAYESFDDYMQRALSRATRKNLRRKFRKLAAAPPLELEVLTDVDRVVDEIYPLYLNVYARADFRFEKLTRDYLVRLGREMPDTVRFFVWRQEGKAVAFCLCMLDGDAVYDEYVGLDYSVALDLHLWFVTWRDVVTWAIENGFRWYCSTALNYRPKRHFRSQLVPLDFYVAHRSRVWNGLLRRALPLLEPTHRDDALRSFPDYPLLWGPESAAQIGPSAARFTRRARSRSGGASAG